MEPFDAIDELRDKAEHDDADVQRLRGLAESYPNVAELWDFLGDVTQLVHFSGGASVPSTESLECYRKAIHCDPTYAKAHESMGYYHDLFDEWDEAERHFRLAIENGCGDTALIGLARVLEQIGRHDEAQETLGQCGDESNPALVKLRSEIAEGLWAPDVE